MTASLPARIIEDNFSTRGSKNEDSITQQAPIHATHFPLQPSILEKRNVLFKLINIPEWRLFVLAHLTFSLDPI